MIIRRNLFSPLRFPSSLTLALLVGSIATMLVWQDRAPAADDRAEAPVEIGSANWLRSLEAAKQKSAETEKPLLVFFQEVPG